MKGEQESPTCRYANTRTTRERERIQSLIRADSNYLTSLYHTFPTSPPPKVIIHIANGEKGQTQRELFGDDVR